MRTERESGIATEGLLFILLEYYIATVGSILPRTQQSFNFCMATASNSLLQEDVAIAGNSLMQGDTAVAGNLLLPKDMATSCNKSVQNRP